MTTYLHAVCRRHFAMVAALSCVIVLLPSFGGCPPVDNGLSGYILSVTVSPSGSGQVSADPAKATYASSEQVTLTPQPATGYRFDHWQGATAGTDNPLLLTISGNTSIEAVFVTSNTVETKTTSQAKVLPSSVSVQTTSDGKLELTGSGVPTLYPGHVVYSSGNGGLLARVKSVTSQDGRTILETEPAALTDLYRQVHIEFNSQTDVVSQNVASSSLNRAKTGSRTALDLPGSISFTRDPDTLTLAINPDDVSVGIDGVVMLKMKEISFTFTPVVAATVDIENASLNYFKCVASGNVTIVLEPELTITAIKDWMQKEITVAEISIPMTTVAPPIPYTLVFRLKVGIEGKIGSLPEAPLNGKLTIDTGLSAGAEYDNGRWSPIGEFHLTSTPEAPNIDFGPVELSVFAKPEFGIKLFDVAGPFFAIKDYMKFVGNYRTDLGVVGAELRKGDSVEVSLELSPFDLFKFGYEKTLWDSSFPLLARLLFTTDPSGLATISSNPSEGFAGTNFFWNDPFGGSTINVNAIPNPDFEVAGYRVDYLCQDKIITKGLSRLDGEPIDASKMYTALIVPVDPNKNGDGSDPSGTVGPYKITTEVFPAVTDIGRIVIYPQKTGYHKGDNVLVRALDIRNSGYTFHHWESDCGSGPSGDSQAQECWVPGNCTIRAVYAANPGPYARHLRVPQDYPTIQAGLDAATYNEFIRLEEGTYSGEGNRELDFHGRYLTIIGQGADRTIIDLQGSATEPHRLAELWDVDGTETFQSLCVRNGYAGSSSHVGNPGFSGGAIMVSETSSVKVADCVFQNCTAPGGGAAIWYDRLHLGSEPSTLFISGTRFENCNNTVVYVRNMGAPGSTKGYNNAVSTVTFNTCTFANDTGGAISCPELKGNLTVTNSQFDSIQGGAIDVYNVSGLAQIDNSTFTNNSGVTDGSAISCADNTLIQKCTFTGNTATNHAGAVAANTPVQVDGHVDLEDCDFNGNSSKAAGALSLGKRTVMRLCRFSNNRATHGDGGAAWIAGSASDCTFTGNYASSEGGGAEIQSGGLVEGSSFSGNSCDLWGGAVFLNGGVVTGTLAIISGGTMDNNQAKGAGAIFGSEGIIRNVTITNNRATGRLNGGAISGRDVKIYNCTITNNQAIANGGGVAVSGSESLLTGCTIDSNTAAENGGGIHSVEATITLCTITNNTAAQGGGIWSSSNAPSIIKGDNTLSGNNPDNCYAGTSEQCAGFE